MCVHAQSTAFKYTKFDVGVLGFYYNNFDSTDNTIEETQAILKESKIITRGDFVINIASMPIKEKGMTNMLKLGKIS